jgi:ATP-dependent Clp endopeptidase proteolytic subunit ClpP
LASNIKTAVKGEKVPDSDPKKTSEEGDEETVDQSLLPLQFGEEEKLRTVGLFGDVNTARTEEIIFSLHALNLTKVKKIPVDYEDLDKGFNEETKPVEFLISTIGGDACDMFAIYDTIRYLRDGMDIETFGLGKVMSAGILLLACGTKGKRKIGRNCRLMVHGVASGTQGSISNLKVEMTEIKKIQEMYVDALVEETKLTKAQLKRMMSKNVNVYLSAEEAVKYGIADIIV